MKITSKTILINLLFLFPFCLFAQSLDQNVISQGRIELKDNTTISGYSISWDKKEVEYIDDNNLTHTINLNNVSSIEQYKGNGVKTFGTIGAVGGGGLGILYSINNKEVEIKGNVKETTYYTWPIYVGGFVGALIGGILGSTIEYWDEVYSNEGLTYHNRYHLVILPNKYDSGFSLLIGVSL